MSQEEKIAIMLVLVFTIFLVVLGLLFISLIVRYRKILEKKQREALNNLITGQDTERERLSRDLHDQLGPQINAIAMIMSSVKPGDAHLTETLNDLKEELWKTQEEVRNISHDLMSLSLRKYGLMEAIRKFISRNSDKGITIKFNTDTDGEELTDRQISHFYSILREMLFNSFKHSGADEVDIRFHSDPQSHDFVMEYSDNGKGSQQSKDVSEGIGVGNIRTRVMLMDGDFEMSMNNGFKAKIRVKHQMNKK